MRSRQPPLHFASGHKRSPLPRLWLMSDERMGDALLASVAALPRGAGVILRHYATPPAQRRALFRRVGLLCRHGGITLYLADTAVRARAWGADGVHLKGGREMSVAEARLARKLGLGVTMSAHDRGEVQRANRGGAVVILSPVFATPSHAGKDGLGQAGFAALARLARNPVIALGGMNAERYAGLHGAYGWAGIDALIRK